MTEQELLKLVVQSARFSEPAASFVLALHYSDFQATTSASAVSTTPVFVDQPLYFPYQPSVQAVQCKAYVAGEGPPREIAVGSCVWSDEDGKVLRKTITLKDSRDEEVGVCELMMHTIGCGIVDAISRTISSTAWLSLKCIALPNNHPPADMHVHCSIGNTDVDNLLCFQDGACHLWSAFRLAVPPAQPAPESNELPGYRALVTLNVSAEEQRAVVFSGISLGEPQLVWIRAGGGMLLLEVCLFSKSVDQMFVIDQISASLTSPATSECVLLAMPIDQGEDVQEFIHSPKPCVGGVIQHGQNMFTTGWRTTRDWAANLYEHLPSGDIVLKEQHHAIASDENVVDPTCELHFKFRASETEYRRERLLQELHVQLRSVTRPVLSPSNSVSSIASPHVEVAEIAEEEKSTETATQGAAQEETKVEEQSNKSTTDVSVEEEPTAAHETNPSAMTADPGIAHTRAPHGWEVEKQRLEAELRSKQSMVERLLVEFQRRGEALEQCGEEMHRLRLEKNDAVKSLKTAKNELRKSRNQSEQQLKAVVRQAFGNELSVDNADVNDLRQVIRALADRLAVVDEERMELKRLATESKATKTAHATLQKQLKELQGAHLQQAAELQKIRSAKSKITKYQETIVMQEKVITRLQEYVAHFRGQRSITEAASQTEAFIGGQPMELLGFQLSQDSTAPSANHVSLMHSSELQAACVAKDHRIAALEKQLVEASRNASREISELKMQLFDMELKLVMAGVPDGEDCENQLLNGPSAVEWPLRASGSDELRNDFELPAIVSNLQSDLLRRPTENSGRERSARSIRRASRGSETVNSGRKTADEQQHLSSRSTDRSPRSVFGMMSGRGTVHSAGGHGAVGSLELTPSDMVAMSPIEQQTDAARNLEAASADVPTGRTETPHSARKPHSSRRSSDSELNDHEASIAVTSSPVAAVTAV